VTPDVTRGREAFARRAWSDAHAALGAARDDGLLGPVELEELAVAAYFDGDDDAAVDAWDLAHRHWLEAGDTDRAGRAVAWLGLTLLFRGDTAQASGWFHRGRRIVAGQGAEGAGLGYLLVAEAIEILAGGDPTAAESVYERVVAIADTCGDRDLLALGLMGRGECAVHAGDTQRGLAFLDDAMVSVTTGELSELMAGLLYCAVLDVCMQVLDMRRGVEWTEAFTRWCEQSNVVAYRGQCLIHRSQVLQAHGRWVDALSEATQAESWLERVRDPAIGVALYQQGELHRLRGELAEAAACYGRAADKGFEPTPGIALLQLAEGRTTDAAATVRRMLDETHDPPARAAVLAVAVEIALAAEELHTAERASAELDSLTAASATPYLQGLAAHVRGAVAVAVGDPVGGLTALRRAGALWRELSMPYEEARCQVLVARACDLVRDLEAAERARTAARRTFERLGAVPDLARLDRSGPSTRSAETHLTERECEVLRLVAQGRTNREIGATLAISEHTAARHVQNIFTKIDVGSRAAATSWAYEHGVV
jgi:DNA-binding CsgD family transcriptional regulator/tetratricopeptide (TPR) repeat protein